MSGPSQENVDIANELLKVIQGLQGELDKLAQKATSAGQAISEGLNSTIRETNEETTNLNSSQSELSQNMQQTTEGADALRASLGLQTEVSKELDKSTKGNNSSLADMAKKAAGVTIAVSAMREAWEATRGVFSLVHSGFTGLMGLFEGGIGLVTGFFGTLFKAGSDYYNKAAGEYFEANQAIIESFGDLKSNEGAFVKDMAADLRDAQNDLAGAGKSLYSTIGNGAAILKEATALAQGFGNSLTSLQDQIKGAADEMFLMSKGMGMSADSLKQLAKNAQMTGGSFEESMQSMMVASAHLSKKFGVSVKVIGKNLDQMTKDFENFGHLSEKELVATATYAAKLGVEIQALQGVMDKFDSFESAAEAAGKLNEAFGMNIDTMKMMNAENPAERIDMLRQSLMDSGKAFEDLSRHEKKLMAQTMGMDMGSLQAAMSIDPDEMGFDDVSDAAEEAAEKMSPEDAMIEVSKSIREMTHSLRQLADGPLSNFITGFMEAIEMSPQFHELLGITGKFLKVFRDMGKVVGQTFLTKFKEPLEVILQYFRDLFSTKRITEFKDKVVAAFGEFFEAFNDPDADMAQVGINLMEKLWNGIQSWINSGPNATGLGNLLKDYLIRGLKALGGMMSFIIKKASEYIIEFTKQFKDFMESDKDATSNITEGIGGALIEALGMIGTTMKNDLWPAVKDLMFAIFDEFKYEIAMVLGAIFSFIIIKAIIAALATAAVSNLLKNGIAGFGDGIKNMLSGLGFGGDAEEEAAEEGANMADQLQTLTSKLAEMENNEIKDATKNAWTLGGLLLAGLAMIAAVGVLAYTFQQAGVSPVMILTVVASLVGTTFALKLLVEATKGMNEGDIKNAGIVMLGAGALFVIAAFTVVPAMVMMANQMQDVTLGSVLSALASLSATMLATMGLMYVAMRLAKVAQGLGPQGMGVAALLLAAAVGIFYLLTKMNFGGTIAEFANQLNDINGVKLAADMLGLLVAFTALTALMAVMIPFSVVGTVAFGLLSAMYYSGMFNKPGDGMVLGIPGLLLYIGEGLTMAFEWVTARSAMKILGGVAIFGIVLFAMKKLAELLKSVKDELGGIGLALSIAAIAGLAYMFGNPDASITSKDAGLSTYMKDIVTKIDNVKLKDPAGLDQKLTVIKEIVSMIAELGQFIVEATKVATLATVSGKDEKVSEMLASMAGFIGLITDNMKTSVDKIITLALDIQTKLAGKTIDKEIKIINTIIQNIVNMGLGLMKPFQDITKNAGFFQKLMGRDADLIAATAKATKEIMGELKATLPGLITDILAAVPAGTNINELYGKALALEATMNGILAVAQAMKILWDLQKNESWIGGEEGAKKLNTIMKTIKATFWDETTKTSQMKMMFNKFYDMLFGADPIKFTVSTKIRSLVADTLVNIKQTTLEVLRQLKDNMFDKRNVASDLEYVHGEWKRLEQGKNLPSDVLMSVFKDAWRVQELLGEYQLDLNPIIKKTEQIWELYRKMTQLFTRFEKVKSSGVNLADVLKRMAKESIDIKKIVGGQFVDLAKEQDMMTKYFEFFKLTRDLMVIYEKATKAGRVPSQMIEAIAKEAKELSMAMAEIEADLGVVEMNPTTKALLTGGDTKEFIVRPDNMTIKINLQVQMEAKKIAKAIVECTPEEKGFFETTKEAKDALASDANRTGMSAR